MAENGDEELQTGAEGSQEQQNSQVANKNSASSTTKKIQDFMSKFNKNKAGSRTLVKVLAKILVPAGWIILAFIIIVGIIMFFLTMPGMVMEKLKGLFTAAADALASFFGESSAEQFKDVEIYNVLNYLDDMGYDLKGYGFVTEFLTKPNTEYDKGGAEGDDVPPEQRKSTKDGVIRDMDDNIITGISDFIRAYLISENYIYTIKNFNVKTDHWWQALGAHISNFFTGSLSNREGMLVFYHDSGIARRGGSYQASELGSIKFEDKKLLIKKGWFNAAMEYTLDGWTGRYGMPVDFLLTVHLATQMPDLAFDMTKNFTTEVNILLNSTDGETVGSYRGSSGYVDSKQIESAMNGFEGGNPITRFTNWLDDWNITAKEGQALRDLGIIPPEENCSCEFDIEESENEGEEGKKTIKTICSACEKFFKYVINHTKDLNDFGFLSGYTTYTPYIESVQDHWFRDVYFVNRKYSSSGGSKAIDSFVDYDKQYEVITGERWTLYETYTEDEADENHFAGDFKYYEINEDGSYKLEGGQPVLYDGKVISGEMEVEDDDGNPVYDKDGNLVTERYAARGEDGTLVAKKAVTIKLSEQAEDLKWNDMGSDSHGKLYSAYDPERDLMDEYQPAYTEEKINAESEEWKKTALSNIFVRITIPIITQTGDGLRTETNPKIKKMFLTNQYFKYDGSQQRAEIIYALREKLKSSGYDGYGPIDKSLIYSNPTDESDPKIYSLTFDKYPSGKFTSEASDGEYELSRYVGSVSFQQDALNTFAMLENSHTVDADYIYKDFKELVVEFGYFTKEELIESKPKLLQWPVPETGSSGYPDRSIDKREGEYGTMIHSKADIDANMKNIIASILAASPVGGTEEPEGAGDEWREPEGAGNEWSSIKKNDTLIIHDSFNMMGEVASLSNTPMASLKSVGVITNVPDTSYTFTPSGGRSMGTKTGDLEFNGVNYEVWKQTHSTCTLYAFAFMAHVYTGDPFESYLKTSSGSFINATSTGQGSNEYWSGGFLGTSFERVGIEGEMINAPSSDETLEKVSKALSEGKPVYFYGNLNASGDCHAVVLLGAGDGGKVVFYDPGTGIIDTYPTSGGGGFAANLTSLFTNHFNHWVFIPDEAPSGSKNPNQYVGYLGNEAVVSPVTGILVEYGTYDADEAQENRENIDIKYGGLIEGKTFKEETVTDPETGEETTEIVYPSDQVGYAVIKILDAETYKKLETEVSNKWSSNSLVKINERATDYDSINKHVSFREDPELVDEDRDWTKVEETVYGYKEFVELYEKFGIAGDYIYIDGFKTEQPGTVEENPEPNRSPIFTEYGEPLTIDSFKISESQVESGDIDISSYYIADKTYKLVSEEYTKKAKAEADIKNGASMGITFDHLDKELDADQNFTEVMNEYILIKEGTLLGRTFTDEEIVNARNEVYGTGTYEEYIEAQEKSLEEAAKLAGSTTDGGNGTEPEIVDGDLKIVGIPLMGNYLRIIMQQPNGDIIENVEDYMKLDVVQEDNDWELFFWLPFESGGTDVEGCGPESQGSCSNGETAVGIAQWTVLLKSNLNNIAEQFIPGCLEEDAALCAELKPFESWSGADFWSDYNGAKQFQAVLTSICNKDRDAFIHVQMEVCKKNYLEPLLETYPWLEDRPSCVQGAVMHLRVWGAKTDWLSSYSASSDEDIVLKVRNTIANTGSTVGPASGDESTGRAFSEPEIALGILSGKLSASDVEEWVRTGDTSVLTSNGVEYRGP